MKMAIVVLVALSACGLRNAPADSPRAQCLDWADAAADLSERCYPGTRQDALNVFLEHMNGCDVQPLRDPAGLYDECVPYLEEVSCSTMFIELPRGCAEQVEKQWPECPLCGI